MFLLLPIICVGNGKVVKFEGLGKISGCSSFMMEGGNTFLIDSIRYKISGEHLEIIGHDSSKRPKGHIIPVSTFSFHGKDYELTTIGKGAFSNCHGIYSIDLPESVSEISCNAFENCINLKSITIPEKVKQIETETFYGCENLRDIVISKNVASIKVSAFYNCHRLTSITIDPENPVYDSRGNCNAIIYTKSNTLIIGCAKTVIPNGVVCIESNAFDHNYLIKDIICSKSIVTIRKHAFYGCKNVNSISLQQNVTEIEEDAFYGCDKITSIKVKKENKKYDSRNNCNAIIETKTNKLIFGCAGTSIPNSVTCIGKDAFARNSLLTYIKT